MNSIESWLEKHRGVGEGQCQTRYPLVLLHGLGYRDDLPLFSSWGRIPDFLARGGARVYLGGLDAWASHENNAALLKSQIERWLGESGAGKFNLIAHSKGGLEARYMISQLGMTTAVASLTTVCTPHRGTSAADCAIKLLPDTNGLAFNALNFFSAWLGDRAPASGVAIKELSRPFMNEFNRRIPDHPAVYYQSIGSQVRGPLDDPVFTLASAVVGHYEGANDGVVPASSCQWGRFLGLVKGSNPARGLSHLDMVDFRQEPVGGVEIPLVYVALAEELKELGY